MFQGLIEIYIVGIITTKKMKNISNYYYGLRFGYADSA